MTDIERFNNTIADLEAGRVRVAEKVDGEWKVNSWVKEVILSGFRLGKLTDMTQGQFSFHSPSTFSATLILPLSRSAIVLLNFSISVISYNNPRSLTVSTIRS